MRTKASTTGGKSHHLYFQEYLDSEPKNVVLEIEITGPSGEFSVTKETTRNGVLDNLVVEIPAEFMDDIATDSRNWPPVSLRVSCLSG